MEEGEGGCQEQWLREVSQRDVEERKPLRVRAHAKITKSWAAIPQLFAGLRKEKEQEEAAAVNKNCSRNGVSFRNSVRQ